METDKNVRVEEKYACVRWPNLVTRCIKGAAMREIDVAPRPYLLYFMYPIFHVFLSTNMRWSYIVGTVLT